MKINEIITEQDTDKYLEFFKTLKGNDFESELDMWNEVIQKKHTHIQFLAFLKVTDELGYDNSSNNLEMKSVIEGSIKELSYLVDYTLDNYNSSNEISINRGNGPKEFGDRKTKLLDSIFSTISECEILNKYYNEKIIN